MMFLLTLVVMHLGGVRCASDTTATTSTNSVHQFVLSILVVFIKVAIVVVVIINGAARIAAPTAGDGHLLFASGAHTRIDSPRTGWLWLGHIIDIDFQFCLL